MATATYNSTNNSFAGGSSSDRLTLTDLTEASGSPLSLLVNNVARNSTNGINSYSLASNSFSDLSGGTLTLINSADNQALRLQLDGDVIIGANDDAVRRDFKVIFGPEDISNNHADTSAVALLASTGKIVCNKDSRIVWQYDHSGASLASEPGSRAPVIIENNNSASKLKMTWRGGPYAEDKDWSANADDKANGSSIIYWKVGSNVTERDFEIYDGYIDFRPLDGWSPFTRAVLVSATGIKFNGDATATLTNPLIMGSSSSSFTINMPSTKTWLHGLFDRSEATSRFVYLNLDGVDLSSKIGLYAFNNANNGIGGVQFENHLILDAKVIDANGNAINDATIKVHSRKPTYSSWGNAGSTTFPTANAVTATATTASDGTASIGANDGNANNAICIEAITRSQNTGGNYPTATATSVGYGSHTALTYDIYKFGKEIIAGNPFTAKKSGQDDAGKQSLGTIQLLDDTVLTSANASAVPTTASTLDDIYDIIYKDAITNQRNLPGTYDTATKKFTFNNAINLTLGNASATLSITDTAITIPCQSSITAGSNIEILGIETLTLANDVSLDAPRSNSNGTSAIINATLGTDEKMALFKSDGTQIGSTLTATGKIAISASDASTNMKLVIDKAGYQAQIRTLDLSSGGVSNINFGSLSQYLLPTGDAMLTSTSDANLGNTEFTFTNLADVQARVLIGNNQARVQTIFNKVQADLLTDNGLKFTAFGGVALTINRLPSGDSLYLGSNFKVKRKTSTDNNATILATTYADDSQPVDDSNGNVNIVGGLQISDFQEAIITDFDIDPNVAGTQSLGMVAISILNQIKQTATREQARHITTSLPLTFFFPLSPKSAVLGVSGQNKIRDAENAWVIDATNIDIDHDDGTGEMTFANQGNSNSAYIQLDLDRDNDAGIRTNYDDEVILLMQYKPTLIPTTSNGITSQQLTYHGLHATYLVPHVSDATKCHIQVGFSIGDKTTASLNLNQWNDLVLVMRKIPNQPSRANFQVSINGVTQTFNNVNTIINQPVDADNFRIGGGVGNVGLVGIVRAVFFHPNNAIQSWDIPTGIAWSEDEQIWRGADFMDRVEGVAVDKIEATVDAIEEKSHTLDDIATAIWTRLTSTLADNDDENFGNALIDILAFGSPPSASDISTAIITANLPANANADGNLGESLKALLARNNPSTSTEIATAVRQIAIENDLDLQKTLQLILAVIAGTTAVSSNTATFKRLDDDATEAIDITYDEDNSGVRSTSNVR